MTIELLAFASKVMKAIQERGKVFLCKSRIKSHLRCFPILPRNLKECNCNEITMTSQGKNRNDHDVVGKYLLQGIHSGKPYYQQFDGWQNLYWSESSKSWNVGFIIGGNVIMQTLGQDTCPYK